jgi:hypothetical protein
VQLGSLQRLDLSENKLAELPSSICELQDNLTLSVGRNPLEKPSIEQARQGIGAIRRFFGFSKKKEADDPSAAILAKLPPIRAPGEADDTDDAAADGGGGGGGGGGHSLPPLPVREEGEPSRHDWAPPAGTITLFNCYKCAFVLVEGGGDVETVPSDETHELTAAFNLQVRRSPWAWPPPPNAPT